MTTGDTRMSSWLDAGKARLPEIRAFAKRFPFAILPVGSTEQHGPHLPLNTDTLIAERVAMETAKRSVGLVLPAMPVGYAWVWRDIPGTVTLRFDSYMQFIRDVAESLERWGVKAVFIISGHGSNPQPIKHAVRELIPSLATARIRVTLHFLDPNVETHLSDDLLDAERCARAIDEAMMRIVTSADPGHFPVKTAPHCRMCNFLRVCTAGREYLR